MSNKYIPKDDKVKISVTIDNSVKAWIDANLPRRERSAFLNTLARDYITREKELVKRGKEKAKA